MRSYSNSDKLAIALFMLGLVVGLVMYILPTKTPAIVVVVSCLIIVLMIYPIVHFVTSNIGRAVSVVAVAVLSMGLGKLSWPAPPTFTNAHPLRIMGVWEIAWGTSGGTTGNADAYLTLGTKQIYPYSKDFSGNADLPRSR